MGKDISIQFDAFEHNKLQVIDFHINGILDIDASAFPGCTKTLRSVNFPKCVQLIIDGKFGDHALPGHRPPISTIHKRAFDMSFGNGSTTQILQYIERCSHLCQFWKWLDKKERQHCSSQPDSSRNSVYDSWCDEDIETLQKIAKLVPPPPNDLMHAIVTDLHCHNVIFSK